jgi:hypothetical protein
MIQGVLRHQSEMDIQRQYVDTHGQSHVAFAFCHLLGFRLLPRLTNSSCAERSMHPCNSRPLGQRVRGHCRLPTPRFGYHVGAPRYSSMGREQLEARRA